MEAMRTDIPEAGSTWKHKNGKIYTVVCVGNHPDIIDQGREEEYPVMVLYKTWNGGIHGRLLPRWHPSMTEVTVKEVPKSEPFNIRP
jgi:hypothetical protein